MNGTLPPMQGRFVEEDGQTWYRIDDHDRAAPFFVALASDSDVWAFISTAGSLAAGRRDAEGAFFPYETVDRIHRRGEHTGPRTWIRIRNGERAELWQPFAPRFEGGGARSVWKNLSGTRLRFREEHVSGRLSGPARRGWASCAACACAPLRVQSKSRCSTACSIWCRRASASRTPRR
jgi:hypothetical protein